MNEDMKRIVDALLSGKRFLSQIVAVTGLPRYRVRKLLFQMVDANIVRLSRASAPNCKMYEVVQ